MSNVMIDIETLGRTAGCIVLSIGACVFDPRGEGHGETFYRNIDVTTSMMAGFHFDESTLKWWQDQNKNAVNELNDEKVSIEDALYDFADWFKSVKGYQCWCQGSNFDHPILGAAYDKFDITHPWKFWACRDTRTVYDCCGITDKDIPREGTYHNAIDDCVHQVKAVQKALRGGQ